MDIEKIQKVNALARELMKHGQAKSMDDAVVMAEKQLGSGSNVSPRPGLVTGYGDGNQANPVDSVRTIQASQQTAAPEPYSAPVQGSAAENRNPDEQSYDRIAFRKLSQQVEQQAGELKAIRMKMNELIREFNSLQEKAKQKAASPVASQHEISKAHPKSPDQTQFKPVPKKEPHARSGNYTPEDVNIEKIFYSGHK